MAAGTDVQVVFWQGYAQLGEEPTRHGIVVVLSGVEDIFADDFGIFLADSVRDGGGLDELGPCSDDSEDLFHLFG